MLDLKIDEGTEYATDWKSKGLSEWKFLPLHGAFIPKAKRFGYIIKIQFNNTPLVIDQNNFTTTIMNISLLIQIISQKFLLQIFY